MLLYTNSFSIEILADIIRNFSDLLLFYCYLLLEVLQKNVQSCTF